MPTDNADKFFDSYAYDFNAIYDSRNGFFSRIINRYLRKSMRLRFERSIAGCMPVKNKTVLDIGCGPGHYGIALAKMGASKVTGIDFAENMIKLAKDKSIIYKVEHKMEFIFADFMQYNPQLQYDFTIAMGLMDYIENPEQMINKIVSITSGKSFISFPDRKGILAWQRRLRYKNKCPLYMYDKEQIKDLFKAVKYNDLIIEKIARDYFVTLECS